MKKQYFWLSMARQKASGTEFAGVVILELAARDVNDAVRQAQRLGYVPGGVVCKGGPLLDAAVPPKSYVGRVLDEVEAREAMAIIESKISAA